MKLTELLAIYTNPEATDEQKQAALAAYEEANKPAAPDNSELDVLKESIAKLEAKNSELLQEKKTAKQQAEEAARASMTTDELKADYESRIEKLKGEIEGEWSGKIFVKLDKEDNSLTIGDNGIGEFLEEFKKRNGTIMCRELIKYDTSDPAQLKEARERNVFRELCPKFVQDSSEILKKILDNN